MKNSARGPRPVRHPLHSLCSYLGCFPPVVPHRIIKEWAPRGTTVLDPFCGGGTTLVEAAFNGHTCIGVDLNPLAVAIARAKVQSVSLEDVLDRVSALARQCPGRADLEDLPDGLATIFHPRTLAQLVYLRSALCDDLAEDAFLRGAVLGIMHGKFRKGGGTAYLSIDMPNTFSMSPEYVRKFVRDHQLRQLPVDVFTRLRERARHLLRAGPLPGAKKALVLHGDATQLPRMFQSHGLEPAGALVTSPPYLGVLRYGAFNWIRLWFLGYEPSVIDRALDGTDSLDRYLSFMVSFLNSAAEVLRARAPVALVIGDVKEFGASLNLAQRVWQELDGVVPFTLAGYFVDLFDESSKTTRIWGEERKGRATPLDRILVLRRKTIRARVARRSRQKSSQKAGAAA
jgi:hypothetical protein